MLYMLVSVCCFQEQCIVCTLHGLFCLRHNAHYRLIFPHSQNLTFLQQTARETLFKVGIHSQLGLWPLVSEQHTFDPVCFESGPFSIFFFFYVFFELDPNRDTVCVHDNKETQSNNCDTHGTLAQSLNRSLARWKTKANKKQRIVE